MNDSIEHILAFPIKLTVIDGYCSMVSSFCLILVLFPAIARLAWWIGQATSEPKPQPS